VYLVVVPGEQVRGVDAYRRDVLGVVAVTRGRCGQRQPEPLVPPARGPDLLGVGDAGDVIVLHAGEVPDEPRDGVRVVDAGAELLRGQPLDDVVHVLANAAEGVGQQVHGVHLSPFLARWPRP
jgi:hypothetical protein